MIQDAEQKGILKKGDTLIEVSSGNTGISLAGISLLKGYHLNVILPNNASSDRVNILKGLGAEIIFVKPEDWRDKAISYGKELAKKNNWIMLNQYENEANVKAHYTTAEEILNQLGGRITPDFVVLGIGTGGTITGISKVLKQKFPKIKVIGIVPKDRIEGLRGFKEFKPPILDLSVIDKIVEVSEEEAIEGLRDLVMERRLSVGVSSGAAFFVSKKIAGKEEGTNIIALFPDGADRYSDLYSIKFKAKAGG
jgi:cysteine synthase A